MKTIVYQSYRTTNVPVWITSCMQTVRSWAEANGFEYQFIDDRLFDYAPSWFREKSTGSICPVTDLARLIVAKEFLSKGYDRTIWIDADMLVFAPERLVVNAQDGFSFCHETWVKADTNGNVVSSHHINNSITAFTKSNMQLDFLIDAYQRIARAKPQLGKLDVGTSFLSLLGNILPIPLLTNVGMFSPEIMLDIANDTETYIKAYGKQLIAPLACANLCASLIGLNARDAATDHQLYQTVVEKCLQSKGDVINRYFVAGGVLHQLNKN